ncbi:OmpA family protein [Burkholderia cepacia]|nr:OmpA family protein [Burkholderia cepacia]RQT71097.1 OmpA family protein [Burkholderia cepacia]RQT91823.1 OmpA family protein [Burkholderia cepacia]RQZ67873.1 OmpA family protein [Burkholderia cepacia]RQZ90183.1 OmpA family protein [Burkholderia cepacia]RQZ95536.1 OmpA family protein [Burkholderia cepacia]
MAGPLLATTLLSGCGWPLSPERAGLTYNTYALKLPNGESAYRVMCYGVFEGSNVCQEEATAACKGQPVRPIDATRLGAVTNARELWFQCGAEPVVAAPKPEIQARPLPPPLPKTITLSGDANFDTAQSTLTPLARNRLDDLIDQAQGVTFKTVTAYGYTDSVGSDRYNQALSERRAQSVISYLKSHGLAAMNFVSKGYGKQDPVASNSTVLGRAKNRRVELTLN